MEQDEASLLALPTEIIDEICSYLGAKSFLRFTAICKSARLNHLNDWLYWSTLVQKHFRFPNQPVVEKEGRRWRLLYKRLQTDTRAYTWGQGGALGHSERVIPRNDAFPPAFVNVSMPLDSNIPKPIEHTENIGTIVDLQCGGWSTVILSSAGALYVVGKMNPERVIQRGAIVPERLDYPSTFSHPHSSYDPATAVSQFSAGRGHILAISDSGRIWSWTALRQPAVTIKFLDHSTVENRSTPSEGVVTKVVAGWSHSAAHIQNTGIVIWRPYEPGPQNEDVGLIAATAVVPNSHFSRSTRFMRERTNSKDQGDMGTEVGEVKNFIMLENHVVFCTDLGRVFAGEIVWTRDEQNVPEVVELPLEGFAKDIQGSFRRLGLFLESGEVLLSTQDAIVRLLRRTPPSPNEPTFTRIPALQKDVIQLAFGDWHFHALHSDGRITSYGKELGFRGALGLGLKEAIHAGLRGCRCDPEERTYTLQQQSHVTGRTVWFDAPKYEWLEHIAQSGSDPLESAERYAMCLESRHHALEELSEWIEQESRDWEHKYDVSTEDDDDLPAYLALSVAAAGWNSGSLVLVNQSLAERVEKAVIETDESNSDGGKSGIGSDTGNADARLATDNTEMRSDSDDTEANSETGLASGLRTLGSSVAAYSGPLVRSFVRAVGSRLYCMFYGSTAVSDEEPRRDPIRGSSVDDTMSEDTATTLQQVHHVWDRDPFPRLHLSDGTDMPGRAPFNDWRYGKPAFDHTQRFDI